MAGDTPLVGPGEIGRQIRDMRDERGMKQKYLASKAGITREELSRIKCGRVRMPRTETLQGICAGLGVTVGSLLDGRRD